MPPKKGWRVHQYQERNKRLHNPLPYIKKDYGTVYANHQLEIGIPSNTTGVYDELSRDNTIAILGAQFGDEGKGRLVDNKLQTLVSMPHIKTAYVIRFQGGANAGHTVYTNEGVKVALHQVPSSVLEPKAVGVMDRGMIINMEDLKVEIEDVEKIAGNMQGRLILSEEALLNTDLERATEVLNRKRSGGKAEGGTTRGIGPTYADHYSRLGLAVKDLMSDNWKEVLGKRYERAVAEFKANNLNLADIDVPDLRQTRDTKKAVSRKVGAQKEFLDRLDYIRTWFIKRDEKNPQKKLIQNTYPLHEKIMNDPSAGIIFEGAQAIGLHPWVGQIPDVTASNTTLWGVAEGTRFYTASDIQERIGVFKVTYMSRVGKAKPLTGIPLERAPIDKPSDPEQYYAWRVREEAHERGTTTGRYRDICYLDLEFMRYNIKIGGIEMLAATHLDISWPEQPIKVCTHYINKQGKVVHYQPGIEYQDGLLPVYLELPGWDGQVVRKAKSLDELPDNARKYLAFIQLQLSTPIVAATTGPERPHLLLFTS